MWKGVGLARRRELGEEEDPVGEGRTVGRKHGEERGEGRGCSGWFRCISKARKQARVGEVRSTRRGAGRVSHQLSRCSVNCGAPGRLP